MSTPVSSTPVVRYSATIKLELVIGDRTIRVGQVAPDYIIIDTPVVLAPGPAVLVIVVDGRITRREIDLPQGATFDSCIIPIVRR